MPLSKRDLVDDLRCAHSSLTRKQATAFVNDLLPTVAAALKRGDGVRLLGFGIFDVRVRAARTGFNPTTKKPLAIPGRQAVHFRA
jgi:DNA-binding protein HU-beta